MSHYDYRQSEGKDSLSYYIFANLRSHIDGEGGDFYRYDTLSEAIQKYRDIAREHPHWTIALGGCIGSVGEIDFIHRRHGANVLVDDFQRIDGWNERAEVKEAVRQFHHECGIEWQPDRSLLEDTVFIPYAPEGRSDDPVLSNKALLPRNPEFPITSVSEAYVGGRGWISLDDLRQEAREAKRDIMRRPMVSRLSVAYETMDGRHTGHVDIEPNEFRGMNDRLQELQNRLEQEREKHLAAENAISSPVPDDILPDTGKPFFNYATSYGETERVNITIGTYAHDDNIYVGLDFYDPDIGCMDFYGDVTVNITKLQPFMACIDTNNNNAEKITTFLTENGFGEPAGRSLPSGFCLYPVFRLNPQKLYEADPFGFKQYCKNAGIELKPTLQESANESLDDVKKRAKERSQSKNHDRPEIQHSKNRDLEL